MSRMGGNQAALLRKMIEEGGKVNVGIYSRRFVMTLVNRGYITSPKIERNDKKRWIDASVITDAGRAALASYVEKLKKRPLSDIHVTALAELAARKYGLFYSNRAVASDLCLKGLVGHSSGGYYVTAEGVKVLKSDKYNGRAATIISLALADKVNYAAGRLHAARRSLAEARIGLRSALEAATSFNLSVGDGGEELAGAIAAAKARLEEVGQ